MSFVVNVNELPWGKRRGWLQRKNEKAQSAREGMFNLWTVSEKEIKRSLKRRRRVTLS